MASAGFSWLVHGALRFRLRMRLVIAFTLAVIASGCSPSGDGQTPEQSPNGPVITASTLEGDTLPDSVPGGQVLTSLGDLVGEYQVVRIHDWELAKGETIEVSIDGALLSYEPTCAGFVWEIDFAGERLELKRLDETEERIDPQEPNAPPRFRLRCLPVIPPSQTQLAKVFDAATRVERTGEGQIRIAGGGRSVVLVAK